MVDGLQPQYAGKVDFVIYGDVNADRSIGGFAGAHGVEAVPTMVVVSPGGREVGRIVGGCGEAELRAELDRAY